MLILSRRIGEGIVIGCDIELIVRKRKGKQVLLAITAPPSILIRRGELLTEPARQSAPGSPVSAARRRALKHGTQP